MCSKLTIKTPELCDGEGYLLYPRNVGKILNPSVGLTLLFPLRVKVLITTSDM